MGSGGRGRPGVLDKRGLRPVAGHLRSALLAPQRSSRGPPTWRARVPHAGRHRPIRGDLRPSEELVRELHVDQSASTPTISSALPRSCCIDPVVGRAEVVELARHRPDRRAGIVPRYAPRRGPDRAQQVIGVRAQHGRCLAAFGQALGAERAHGVEQGERRRAATRDRDGLNHRPVDERARGRRSRPARPSRARRQRPRTRSVRERPTVGRRGPVRRVRAIDTTTSRRPAGCGVARRPGDHRSGAAGIDPAVVE